LEQEYYAIWEQQKGLGLNGTALENISLVSLLREKPRTANQLITLLKTYPWLQKHYNLILDKPPTDFEEDELFCQMLTNFQCALTNFGEFRALPIKPRRCLLGKWMKEGDTGFVYGQRGAGKTWLVNLIVSHLSTGRDIDEDWNASVGQIHVVLVDGEMPYDDTKARLHGLGADDSFLHLLHHEVLFDRTGLAMNLTQESQQRIVTQLCEQTQAKLLVLDTLSSLFRGMAEDKSDAWELALPWLLDLRRRRITTLIVAHAGRDGTHMRGTTRREDDAFWIISVKELADRGSEERGARFETAFAKWRNLDSPPLLRQWSVQTESNGIVSYNCNELTFDAQVLAKIQAGLESSTDIAQELGVHKSRVSRASDRLADAKLIDKCGKGNRITYKPRGFMRNDH
jgi:putative DNA primase/helicase